MIWVACCHSYCQTKSAELSFEDFSLSLAQNHHSLVRLLAVSYALEHLCSSLAYCSFHGRKLLKAQYIFGGKNLIDIPLLPTPFKWNMFCFLLPIHKILIY